MHKNQYLKAMGVDVWVPRPAMLAQSDEQVDDARPTAATQKTTEQVKPSVKPISPEQRTPEFHLCFSTYDRLSFIFAIPNNASELPQELRRFIDDVALACGDHSQPRISELKWPMVNASHIKQSGEDAKTTFQTRLVKCKDALAVFGELPENYLDEGRGFLQLDDIKTYLSSPLKKRVLFQKLKGFSGE